LKISIITVCYNAQDTIESTIKSVLLQDYNNIEYIIIDGSSTDNTMSIISKYQNDIDIIITEKDNGIYDAINKGISFSTGEIIGLLNADDELFDNDVINKVANIFINSPNIDSIIGDIVFIGNSQQTIRKYSSRNWSVNLFSWGFMPPHPSFYCKRSIYKKFGGYDINYKIASDFELLLRFLKIQKINYQYLPSILVKMKTGGVSTRGLKSLYVINKEIREACFSNGIKTNYLKLYSKYFIKIFEFLKF